MSEQSSYLVVRTIVRVETGADNEVVNKDVSYQSSVEGNIDNMKTLRDAGDTRFNDVRFFELFVEDGIPVVGDEID